MSPRTLTSETRALPELLTLLRYCLPAAVSETSPDYVGISILRRRLFLTTSSGERRRQLMPGEAAARRRPLWTFHPPSSVCPGGCRFSELAKGCTMAAQSPLHIFNAHPQGAGQSLTFAGPYTALQPAHRLHLCLHHNWCFTLALPVLRSAGLGGGKWPGTDAARGMASGPISSPIGGGVWCSIGGGGGAGGPAVSCARWANAQPGQPPSPLLSQHRPNSAV